MLDIHSYISKTIYKDLFDSIDLVAKNEGATVFVVGGFIRDILLKKNAKFIGDIDFIVFNINFIDFAYKFADYTHNIAILFKDNVRVLWKGKYIDISAPRGRDIYEDLLKRDFTINNVAMDLSGRIYGNVDDIISGIIRPVYPEAFHDDPLRILRGFRQAAKYNFYFDSFFFDLIKSSIDKISEIPSERVIQELRLISLYPNKRVFSVMDKYSVWEHVIGIINCANYFEIYSRCFPLLSEDEPFALLMASIVIASNQLDTQIFKRLPFSNKELNLYKILISVYNLKGDVKRYIYRNYNRIDLLVEFARASSIIDNNYASKVIELNRILDYTASELVTGNDILIRKPKFISSGKWIGDLLEDIKTKLAFKELLSKKEVNNYIDLYIQELKRNEN